MAKKGKRKLPAQEAVNSTEAVKAKKRRPAEQSPVSTKKLAKKGKKMLPAQEAVCSAEAVSAKIHSDEHAVLSTKRNWTNKQRVLILGSRGINHRDRHLMEDIKKLIPHHKPESKMERTKTLSVVNDLCQMKHCNKAMLFEGRSQRDLYLWLANVDEGPSVKCLVENVYTMGELKLTGNCLKGSRPLLSFDQEFSRKPHLALIKELLVQIFDVPRHHPKSQPFFDHIYTFSILDNRIWFRNFQILSEDGALTEIGPRFVLNPVKMFAGSFTGSTLWENPHYLSPSKYRRLVRKKQANQDEFKKEHLNKVRQMPSYKLNPLDDIFKEDSAN